MAANREKYPVKNYTDRLQRYGHSCDCGFYNGRLYNKFEPTLLVKLNFCPDCGKKFEEEGHHGS
jgi:ribosomal protein L32